MHEHPVVHGGLLLSAGGDMERKDLVSLLEANLMRQLQWIAAADTKAAFVFSLTTAMLGLLAAVAPDNAADWNARSAIATVIVVMCALVVLASLSLCAFPRTSGPAGSMVFCGGVANLSEPEFRAAACALSHEAYANDLASQCHRNAVIAAEKFRWVRRAIIAMYVALIPWVLAIWWLYSAASGSGEPNAAA